MFPGKILTAGGLAAGIAFASANLADASAGTLALVGVVGSVGAAGVGVYSSYRAAKHQADLADQNLIQNQLTWANLRISVLEQQIRDWQDLADSLRRDAGSIPDPPKGGSSP